MEGQQRKPRTSGRSGGGARGCVLGVPGSESADECCEVTGAAPGSGWGGTLQAQQPQKGLAGACASWQGHGRGVATARSPLPHTGPEPPPHPTSTGARRPPASTPCPPQSRFSREVHFRLPCGR